MLLLAANNDAPRKSATNLVKALFAAYPKQQVLLHAAPGAVSYWHSRHDMRAVSGTGQQSGVDAIFDPRATPPCTLMGRRLRAEH